MDKSVTRRQALRLDKFILFFLRASKLAKGLVNDGTAFKFCLDSEINESSFVHDIFGSTFQQKKSTFQFSLRLVRIFNRRIRHFSFHFVWFEFSTEEFGILFFTQFGSNFQQKNSTFQFSLRLVRIFQQKNSTFQFSLRYAFRFYF